MRPLLMPPRASRRLERNRQARPVVASGTAHAVQFGDRRHQAEAEPVARRRARGVEPIEALEDAARARPPARPARRRRPSAVSPSATARSPPRRARRRGVWRSALSTRLATICVSSSRSPDSGKATARSATRALPSSSAAGRNASTTSRATSARSTGLKPARRAPASIWPMRRIALNVSSTPSMSAIAACDRLRRASPASSPAARRLEATKACAPAADADRGRCRRADVLVRFEQRLDAVEHPVEGARELRRARRRRRSRGCACASRRRRCPAPRASSRRCGAGSGR